MRFRIPGFVRELCFRIPGFTPVVALSYPGFFGRPVRPGEKLYFRIPGFWPVAVVQKWNCPALSREEVMRQATQRFRARR